MTYDYIVNLHGTAPIRVTAEELATLSAPQIHHIIEVTPDGDRMLSDGEATAILAKRHAPAAETVGEAFGHAMADAIVDDEHQEAPEVPKAKVKRK